MSNNIYNILNNFNKVAQEVKSSVTENKSATQKTKLEESMEQIGEKYMGFKKTAAAIKKGSSAENPEAVAAAIGRKKYGKEKFQQAAAAGKKLGEGEQEPFKHVDPRVDAPTIKGTDKKAKSGYFPNPKPQVKKLPADKKLGEQHGVAEGSLNELSVSTLSSYGKKAEKSIDKKLKKAAGHSEKATKLYGKGTASAVDRSFDHEDQANKLQKQVNKRNDSMDQAAGKLKKYMSKGMAEADMDESALQAYLGKKKYGEQGMKALQKAGRDGASKEKMAQIRAKHDKMDEAAKPDYIDLDKDGNKTEPMKDAAKDKTKQKKSTMDLATLRAAAKTAKPVQEVAPPGDKAERMVKHIKKGYGKDGKVTPKEKSIAYATAWKAHNKGKLDETIRALLAAGYTKEQIVEGWQDMMKDVQQRGKEEKGTGKFDKKTISTGTVYTRKYDPKSGETDDTGKDGEGQQVKRGRGRPRKSTFESFATANKMIANAFKSLVEGSIRGGVWTSDPPKKGQPNVPAPSGDPEGVPAVPKTMPTSTKPAIPKTMPASAVKKEEEDMEEGNAFGAAIAKAKADGVQPGEKVEVGGKEYTVKEDEELNQMRRIAGLKECGPMGMGAGYGQESEGRMNISTNMSSDGTKSVTISADGEAAAELLQMLKLAGMGGQSQQPEATLVVSQDDQPEEVEEEKDERYHASTTPDEQVAPIQAQLKGGDGDVAGQEKTMRKDGYQFGDNNLAMREVASEGIQNLNTMGRRLMKEYEAIKVKK